MQAMNKGAGSSHSAKTLGASAKRCITARSAVAAPVTKPVFKCNDQDIPISDDVSAMFQPLKVGDMQLSNRIVYAPLTRCRAIGSVINASAAEYYAQRSVQGSLLITEATIISQAAQGVPHTPGIYTSQQVDAWKPVVDAVKAKGAFFYCQLWHTGRASDNEYQPGGVAPMSSSPVPITSPQWMVYTTARGWGPYQSTPREMNKADIAMVIQQYRDAARNAIAAGFDGVEVHAANGYLIDQFIKDSVNKRTDEYGGSIDNRCRFALEVLAAVVDEVGAARVGVRISPFTVFNDAVDSTPYATHTYLCEKISAMGLAYLHMVEPRVLGNVDLGSTPDSLLPFRQAYKGVFMTAGGLTRALGQATLTSGAADLVCYGRTFLANPDFHKRMLLDAPLNAYDRDTFYSQGSEGYTDYPFLTDAAQ